MRFIELLTALTAVVAVVNAAPTGENRDVINADKPFDDKAFNFDPKMNEREAGRRSKHHKRTGAKACCGNFDLDLKTDLKIGASGGGGGGGKSEPAPIPAPPAAPPAPVAPTPAVAPGVAVTNQDSVNIYIDNKINH